MMGTVFLSVEPFYLPLFQSKEAEMKDAPLLNTKSEDAES